MASEQPFAVIGQEDHTGDRELQPGDEGVLCIELPAKARVHSPGQARLPLGLTQDNYMMFVGSSLRVQCCSESLHYLHHLLLHSYYECSLSFLAENKGR